MLFAVNARYLVVVLLGYGFFFFFLFVIASAAGCGTYCFSLFNASQIPELPVSLFQKKKKKIIAVLRVLAGVELIAVVVSVVILGRRTFRFNRARPLPDVYADDGPLGVQR